MRTSIFDYLADSRVAAKDDLLDNKWDRTSKYDFAGRMTFNQFGMGLGSDTYTMKRVYEQTIQYDAFSQMTSRGGVHWDDNIAYTATYANGRITGFSGDYDEAGNIVHVGDLQSNPHEYTNTTYDAAGRMTEIHTSRKGSQGSILNMVKERKRR